MPDVAINNLVSSADGQILEDFWTPEVAAVPGVPGVYAILQVTIKAALGFSDVDVQFRPPCIVCCVLCAACYVTNHRSIDARCQRCKIAASRVAAGPASTFTSSVRPARGCACMHALVLPLSIECMQGHAWPSLTLAVSMAATRI